LPWLYAHAHYPAGTSCFDDVRNAVQHAVSELDRCNGQPHFARHQNKTFQQDNARAHTARATRDFLQQNNVNVMNWPALSPDLNPRR
jgi:hypothetical protein